WSGSEASPRRSAAWSGARAPVRTRPGLRAEAPRARSAGRDGRRSRRNALPEEGTFRDAARPPATLPPAGRTGPCSPRRAAGSAPALLPSGGAPWCRSRVGPLPVRIRLHPHRVERLDGQVVAPGAGGGDEGAERDALWHAVVDGRRGRGGARRLDRVRS